MPRGPCRIVYLHRLQFSGSSQTIQVLRDYHALLAHGHEAEFFYRAPAALSDGEILHWLAQHDLKPAEAFRLHYISEKIAGKRRLRRAAAARIMHSPRLAVIAVRTMDHARIALGLRRRLTARRVRVVLELHETAFPHMLYREQGRRLSAWRSRRTESAVLRAVDGIVATVGSQVDLLDRLFPDHARCIVLPNGVDLAAFAGDVSRPPDGRFHLRYAGQFLAWKGTDIMIEALAHLPEHVILELAGGKPETEDATRAAIAAAAARSAVAGRVRYVGFLAPRAVPQFLMQADALLLPLGDNVQSRYFTSPMKLFEYAASGVPMIVTRQPTTLSLIGEGREALMVSAGSAKELAQAVCALIDSPSLAASLAAGARTWAEAYSYKERARRYDAFLEGLFAVE